MINNLELIKPLLNFEEKGDFYMLYIFKRKKDFPELEQKNHQSVRTIKTYCIDSLEYLDKRWDEIIKLSELFQARVYIHIQKQNHKDIGMNMITEIVNRLQSGNINQKNVFDSVVGQIKTKEKRWIIDIDSKDYGNLSNVMDGMNKCQPYNEEKYIQTIPTKNGFHLITKHFNVEEFRQHGFTEDLQKKNPTLLYYPNSLENV